MTLLPSLLALAALLPHETLAVQEPDDPRLDPSVPAQTANSDEPHGVLAFELLRPDGEPTPGRLTFVRDGEVDLPLFPGVEARPHNLAVRRNVVYCLSGRDRITVPAGTYTVYASRGIEWSLERTTLEVTAGGEVSWTARLAPELPTAGWVSGDFHLHTLTHSGHGDSNMEERIISLVGEGVEFAVATDHNHNIDYGPTMEALGAQGWMRSVVGNEVSTPIGHLNAFPLDADRAPVDASLTDASALFKLIREEPNAFGVTPVIQLNHPRWEGIDYFTATGLDPVTGTSDERSYSGDFDTLEILNENAGWGYHDADLEHEFSTGSSLHSVLHDWYHLLNRGHRYFAVGNSDSHTVHKAFAGYPRNFVRSSTDDPAEIDPAEVAEALRAGRVFTTTGPFVRAHIGEVETGGTVSAPEGRVLLQAEIHAAQWIFLDRVKVVVNGDLWHEVPLEPIVDPGGRVRWRALTQPLELAHDSWVHVIVEGDESLSPVVTGSPRPVLPLAITNPIWIDADGDGQVRSLHSWALSECGSRGSVDGLRPAEAAALVLAAAERRPEGADALVRSALARPEREVRLAALRAVEELATPGLVPGLRALLEGASDPMMALACLRALRAVDAGGWALELPALFERFGRERVQRYTNELAALAPPAAVRAWEVLGPLDSPDATALFTSSWGEERRLPAGGAVQGKAGSIGWRIPTVRDDGYVDLAALDPANAANALFLARTTIVAEAAGPRLFGLGTDDGCRVWLNGVEVHRDTTRHGSVPLQHVGVLELREGPNELVVGVENGGGATGLHLHLF
jgi:hypothetical protein